MGINGRVAAVTRVGGQAIGAAASLVFPCLDDTAACDVGDQRQTVSGFECNRRGCSASPGRWVAKAKDLTSFVPKMGSASLPEKALLGERLRRQSHSIRGALLCLSTERSSTTIVLGLATLSTRTHTDERGLEFPIAPAWRRREILSHRLIEHAKARSWRYHPIDARCPPHYCKSARQHVKSRPSR